MGTHLITQSPFEYSIHICMIRPVQFLLRANARYEQHLSATRPPGKFPLPRGMNEKYAGVPIEDVPQDEIWWALRPSNRHQDWVCRVYFVLFVIWLVEHALRPVPAVVRCERTLPG